MRKKLFSTTALVLVMTMTMTGCGVVDKVKSIFNKGDDATSDSSTVTEETVDPYAGLITISGTGVHEQNDIVNVEDIVTIDSTISATVSDTAIFGADGSLQTSLATSELGSFTSSVVVQFIDGTSWTGEYSYVVNEPEIQLPDNIKTNLEELVWSTLDVPYSDDSATQVVSYVPSVVRLTSNVSYTYSSDVLFTSDHDSLWNAYVLTSEDEALLEQNNVSPFSRSDYVILMESILSVFTDDMDVDNTEGASETSDDTLTDEEAQQFEWLIEAYDSLFTISDITTDYNIYDVDGNAYPVHCVEAMYNGDAADVCPQLYYVDLADGSKLILTYSYVGEVSYPTDEDGDGYIDADEYEVDDESEDEEDEDDEDEFAFESADEAKAYVIETTPTPVYDSTLASIYDAAISDLTSHFLIGAVEVQTTEGEDTTTGDNSVTVEDTEDSTEDATISDVAESKEGSYKRKYGQGSTNIFSWPEDPSGNSYSRWVYEILSDTSFSSSIWLGDSNTYAYSDSNSENEDWKISSDGSSSSASSSGVNGQAAYGSLDDTSNTVTMLSSYATYYVTDYDIDGTIDTTKSTSKLVTITTDDNTFYMEPVRNSTIQNYLGTCIYSTSIMANEPTIEEDSSADVSTTYGSITGYTITYEDTDGKEQTKGYMAVYNINNDYIVIYADNMVDDVDDLVTMLETMISK